MTVKEAREIVNKYKEITSQYSEFNIDTVIEWLDVLRLEWGAKLPDLKHFIIVCGSELTTTDISPDMKYIYLDLGDLRTKCFYSFGSNKRLDEAWNDFLKEFDKYNPVHKGDLYSLVFMLSDGKDLVYDFPNILKKFEKKLHLAKNKKKLAELIVDKENIKAAIAILQKDIEREESNVLGNSTNSTGD